MVIRAAMSLTYACGRNPADVPVTLKFDLTWLALKRRHVLERTNWATVVVTDEIICNLDGPDAFHKTWHERDIQFQLIDGIFAAANSVSMLQNDGMLDRCRQMVDPNVVFLQDIALLHKSRLVKNFMNDKNVELLDWPTYSPDFNIIKNLWRILARKVYVGAREFQMVLELKNTILLAWETLDQP
ncbi:Transposable element Tc3 transposase [Porphyridium purpureum]|uniref:Transposable element Tc3 transposase n=1 Tax=Porphyridium purpureum TaxID=35688 RepID=A0A5J4YQX1_PORPP|nr:Transposable element Tc3 transposase [Porphyridium purpureum]|eukprot:POR3452..scf222_8